MLVQLLFMLNEESKWKCWTWYGMLSILDLFVTGEEDCNRVVLKMQSGNLALFL